MGNEKIMKVTLRPGTIGDARECGRILFAAFKAIGDQHNFAPDFPTVDIATGLSTMLLSHPRFYSVVAEADGRIVGSNFLDERSTIAGVGPVSVDPPVMNGTVGRQLMQAVMDRAFERGAPGVRLLQVAWHYRSLALYTKLGFDSRETISAFQGRRLE
jgi:predicted N-acetyltransferase YhbS